MQSLRLVAIVILTVLAVAGTISVWNIARSVEGIDFYQFWVGARVAGRQDVPRFYDEATRQRIGAEFLERAQREEPTGRRMAVAQFRRNLDWFSTPLLYMAFGPFSGNYEQSFALYQFLCFVCFIAAMALLVRLLNFPLLGALAFYDAIVWLYEPLKSEARVGNVNLVVLFWLVLAAFAFARGRFALSGALVALVTLFKPYLPLIPIVTVAVMVIQKRWRDLRSYVIGALIATVVAIATSSLYFHSATAWIDWLRGLRAMPRDIVTVELGNVALARIIQDLAGVNVTIVLLVIFTALTIYLVRKGDDVLALTASAVASLLATPLVWWHYLVIAIPLLMVLLRRARVRWVTAAAIAATVLLALFPAMRFVAPAASSAWYEASAANAGLLAALLLTWRIAVPPPPAATATDSRGLPRNARSSRSRASRKG